MSSHTLKSTLLQTQNGKIFCAFCLQKPAVPQENCTHYICYLTALQREGKIKMLCLLWYKVLPERVLILTSKKSGDLNTLGYTLSPFSCSVVTFEHGEQSVAGVTSASKDLWLTVTLMPSCYFPWPEPAKFPWMCHIAKADGWDNKLKIYRGLAEQVRILLTTDHTLEAWFHCVHPSKKRQTPTQVAFIPIPASVL